MLICLLNYDIDKEIKFLKYVKVYSLLANRKWSTTEPALIQITFECILKTRVKREKNYFERKHCIFSSIVFLFKYYCSSQIVFGLYSILENTSLIKSIFSELKIFSE